MLHNQGNQMRVVTYSRLDQLALEPPPNDTDHFDLPPPPIVGLGGPTAPRGAGGMIPPQCRDGAMVATSRAPDCRQDYHQDGGGLTATPPDSVERQERQKGVVSALGDWKDAQVFDK